METTLTLTEEKILRLTCLSSKEIAKLLNVKQTTVRKHQQNIRIKLGVKNNRQAMLKVFRLGLYNPNQFPLTYERGLYD